jgi:GT2 family glycosyltransferase
MLISMAVWDTEENQRTEMTRLTLKSLAQCVDWSRHRLFVSDNGSCQATQDLYREVFTNEQVKVWKWVVIQNGKNLGTAGAVNRGWFHRQPGEHAVKMDNDVVVNQVGWADVMEEVFRRDPSIGICGLKRKDIEERPDHENPNYKSTLHMTPHSPGEPWIVVEEVNHVIGTCQAYSSALLDKIGYLYQADWNYGFDDAFASLRAHIAGFKTVFVPHIDIDHIDRGHPDYTLSKHVEAGRVIGTYAQMVGEYVSGKKPIFYDGGPDIAEFSKKRDG